MLIQFIKKFANQIRKLIYVNFLSYFIWHQFTLNTTDVKNILSEMRCLYFPWYNRFASVHSLCFEPCTFFFYAYMQMKSVIIIIAPSSFYTKIISLSFVWEQQTNTVEISVDVFCHIRNCLIGLLHSFKNSAHTTKQRS